MCIRDRDGGLELHGTGLVAAMHVAKGGGEHEAADATEGLIHFHHVFRGGVKLVGGDTAGVVAVFFTTDDAGFDFEDDLVPVSYTHLDVYKRQAPPG